MNRVCNCLLAAMVAAGLAPPALAQTQEPRYDAVLAAEAAHLVQGARLLVSGEDLDAFASGYASPKEIVDVESQTFGRAIRIRVNEATDPVWAAQLSTPKSDVPIRAGDVLFGSFWVRGEAPTEAGAGQATAYLQKSNGEWTGLHTVRVASGPVWRQRYFHAVAERDFEAGEVNLTFHLGGAAQTFELGGLAIWNLGSDVNPATLPETQITYVGQEPNAPWREEAARRIDEHRKANLAIRIVDAAGQPVPNAQVSAELTRHEFGFGTFIEVNSPVLGRNVSQEDAERYRQVLTQHFNRVTCAVYPADGWGWPNPETRQHNLETIRWALERGFQIRAHAVLWPSWSMSPDAWRRHEDDPENLQATILAHVEEVMTHLEALGVDEVDLVNETRVHTDHERLLGRHAMAEWFKTAKAVAPSVQLGINDYGIISGMGVNETNLQHYETIIQDLLDRGAPVEVIGIQGHMGEDATPPTQGWAVLDRFARFGVPIHITEFTLQTRDEAFQADYFRDFLTFTFAHPAVEAITIWGFWEGSIWKRESALWREDWTLKPAGEAFVKLMTEEWVTSETVGTGADGTATIRGFLGDYSINVSVNGLAVAQTTTTLTRSGDELLIRIGETQQ